MSNTAKLWVHRIYGIVNGVVAIAAGICFILGAGSIYRNGLATGAQPYTYATIAATFSGFSVLVYACLALVLGGILLNIVLPPERKKALPEKNLPLIISRLEAKTDFEALDPQLAQAIERQKAGRKLHSIISAVLLALGSALFLSYACNGANWAPVAQAAQINSCMVKTVFALAICMIIPLGYIIFTAYYVRSSYAKQAELLKQASKLAPFQGAKQAAPVSKDRAVTFIRYGILVIALGLMIYGFCNDGTLDVLAKAAAICTECVGLG